MDHRRLIKEGILKETKPQEEVFNIFVILFSDVILFSQKEKGGNGYQFSTHRVELMANVRVEDQELGSGNS